MIKKYKTVNNQNRRDKMRVYEVYYKENSKEEGLIIYGEENYNTWLEENKNYINSLNTIVK